jgi:hypothetical protein
MLKVSITTTAIQIKSGISSKTGKPYEIREQPAWIFLVDEQGKQQPYPVSFMLMLEKNQAPYALGDYVLHSSSLQSGRFGSLQIRPDIRKVEANVKAAA